MSRMNSIRDAVKNLQANAGNFAKSGLSALKMGGAAAAVGGGAAMGISMNEGKDLRSSMDIGAGAAMGGTIGMAAGFLAPMMKGGARSLLNAGKAGFRSGSFSRAQTSLSRSASKLRPGGAMSMAMGTTMGAVAGGGYAVLESNKAKNPNYSDRLKYDTERKKMIVSENLRQMREMREMMGR